MTLFPPMHRIFQLASPAIPRAAPLPCSSHTDPFPSRLQVCSLLLSVALVTCRRLWSACAAPVRGVARGSHGRSTVHRAASLDICLITRSILHGYSLRLTPFAEQPAHSWTWNKLLRSQNWITELMRSLTDDVVLWGANDLDAGAVGYNSVDQKRGLVHEPST